MLPSHAIGLPSKRVCTCLRSFSRAYATGFKALVKSSKSSKSTTKSVASTTTAVQPRKANNNQGVRSYTPRTPGLRHLRRPINDHLWKGKPFRKLTYAKIGQAKGGRNNSGRITVRHRGGGARRRIRTIDYKRDNPGPHRVMRIEYDPNRSAHLALVKREETGEISYIIAAEGMRQGDVVESFRAGIPKSLMKTMGGSVDPGVLAAKTAFRGNCLPAHMVPLGTQVFNVGSTTGKGAVFCRSAGTFAIVTSKDEVGKKVRDVTVRLQSGELRKIAPDACTTVGVASNPSHQFRQLGKAGRSRNLNIRPTVRGLAMNASDHPHGGGRGKSKGNVDPVSIWGKPAKGGYKTRRTKNINKRVVEARPRNHGKRRTSKH